MPEHEPEQELGPKIADAFQRRAAAAAGPRGSALAAEARRRVRKRRQGMTMAAAAVVVAAAIGGVWNAIGDPSPIASSTSDSSAEQGSSGTGSGRTSPGLVPPQTESGPACPADHVIQSPGGASAVPRGTGLDLETQVFGLEACRYRLTPDAPMLLGQHSLNAGIAQQVVDAIKVLPERNPDLPVFKCTPQLAQAKEAIVLRFDTSAGVKEIWVQYDGCDTPGFFTGSRTYGLYAAPLKLFMIGSTRPTGSTYLNALEGW
ncbi:hypothetical protein E1218_10555 [Kribbella turkmenica]|uniref:Uncharacterized protein n=1 Tax=Kribbella turkmenica TaxID=2530375 RepID=A0A4R4XAL6_9ACTN|nr:hypothetical protein [Kribbella turkmenica]TDD27419.1 hypothetical protein E1218_10555 [Kribbella turkmenica]